MPKITRITKYEALLQINNILDSTLHCFNYQFDALLENVMRTVNEVMQAEASSIMILDKGENQLYFQAATGEKGKEVKRYNVKLGKGIAGWVAEHGKPLLVPDVRNDDRWDPTISEEISFNTRSIICVPMCLDAKVFGVIEVLNSLVKPEFVKEDLDYLSAIANAVAIAIKNAKLYSQVKNENQTLRSLLSLKQEIIGDSVTLSEVLSLVKKVSLTDVSVLIQGETGTGKELIARTIHENSKRKDKPFIVVNCAAIPESLIEEELFGHEKGSFTDAHETKRGKFELAAGGTLFLDEIGDMSLNAQSKVLRVLQDNRIIKIGAAEYIEVDVRIISATNRDLKTFTKNKQFREDLYYRLNEFSIQLPSLRERKEDIPELVNSFIEVFNVELNKQVQGISPSAIKRLMAYNWPGNIRELKNFIRRIMILMETDIIGEKDIQLNFDEMPECDEWEPMRLRDMEKVHIGHILKIAKNKTHAAHLLDISRPTLDKKIKEYNLELLVELKAEI